MVEVTGELRDWEYNDLYSVFNGKIFGDKKERWPDGRSIHTSSVEEIVEREDHLIVYTMNSVYLLMKVHKHAPPATTLAVTY